MHTELTTTTIGRPPAAPTLPSADPATVFVLDADASLRDRLEQLIEAHGWQAETFASADEFLACPAATGPSCLVLDAALPDLAGLEVQQKVAVDRRGMPIVFVSAHGDVHTGVQAMKAGAVEFLTKPFSEDVLVGAIHVALERSRRVLEREARMAVTRRNCASLTRREREVMILVAGGLLNKQIAGDLGISEITVKAHRGQVMRKMRADSLAALVMMVASLGLPTAWGH